ncbi:hydroxyethylthiazole kinase [Escherichia coli]|uniref:hydroxyethylthiazole kinase n=1 Tax=Escherichia coli TaxID=562 RepID=A0A484X1U1_ECOLX|nr:hydroxyethylthiazole kinase [Escherichia coli]
MQVDLLSSAQSAHALHLFHQHSPLVHCMTNDVVQTFTANTLLALGASPAMVNRNRRGQSVCGYRQCLVD